jgi:hypothetical protein
MLVQLPGADEEAALRHRYLDMLLQALHTPAGRNHPGDPPDRPTLTAHCRPTSQPVRG